MVTLETSQLSSGWLKLTAPLNISAIWLALETSQLSSDWLKFVAYDENDNIVYDGEFKYNKRIWIESVLVVNLVKNVFTVLN